MNGDRHIIVQKRDIGIMLACYGYGFVSRDQLIELFGFGSISGANARLRKLCEAKYLERRIVPVALTTAQAIYYLGVKGVSIVAEFLRTDASEVKKRSRRNAHLGEFFLIHRLETNDVRIAFSRNDEVKLVKWLYEPQISLESSKLRPDAFFRILRSGKFFDFFLELDRGTESIRRFVETKAKVYAKIIRAESGKRKLNILTVVPSTRRLTSLWNAVSQATSGAFWFVEKDRLNKNTLAKPVFVEAGDRNRRNLFGGER